MSGHACHPTCLDVAQARLVTPGSASPGPHTTGLGRACVGFVSCRRATGYMDIYTLSLFHSTLAPAKHDMEVDTAKELIVTARAIKDLVAA